MSHLGVDVIWVGEVGLPIARHVAQRKQRRCQRGYFRAFGIGEIARARCHHLPPGQEFQRGGIGGGFGLYIHGADLGEAAARSSCDCLRIGKLAYAAARKGAGIRRIHWRFMAAVPIQAT